MGSALYAATCTSIDTDTVDVELVPTPAIDPHFPLSDFFALAVLHEAACTTVYRTPGKPLRRHDQPGGPLAHELTDDEMIRWSCADSPARAALTARYVVSAAYCATAHWTPSLCLRSPDGLYRRGVSARARGMRAVFEALVSAAVAAGDDDRRVPRATLRIQVTAPLWLAHLSPGLLWDCYAFDDDAPLLG